MKQFTLVFFCALLLTGCNDEKNQYQEYVFNLMKSDQDLIDYSLDPDETTQCIVDTSGKKMPGLFSWDPRRAPIYTGYTDLIKFKLYVSELSEHAAEKDDPNKKLSTLRETFGSAQALADAHRNFSESVLACFESLTSKTDPDNERLL